MPAISKIRFTNVIYENGGKRYNDDIFEFDGENGAILLENGGGKTVFVQTAIQSVLPKYNMENRNIRETLSLEGTPAHIAIEWIINDSPRVYLVTATTLFVKNNILKSYKYTYEYEMNDEYRLEKIPFVIEGHNGEKRPASREEILDYYRDMGSRKMSANIFEKLGDYHQYIEENYNIIPSEWRSIGRINGAEGGVEQYFDSCKNTERLVNNLLIPVVEEAIEDDGKKDFVKLFEKQRERFKKHKELRERIMESKKIQSKIEEYVGVFEKYDLAQKDSLAQKKYVKAVLAFLENEKLNLDLEIEDIDNKQLEIDDKKEQLRCKEESLKIYELEKEVDVCRETYKISEAEYLNLKDIFNKKDALSLNLAISKLKNTIKNKEESIKTLELEIKSLEEEYDLESIKDQILENKEMLRGYFVNQEQLYQAEMDRFQAEIDRFEDEIIELETDISHLNSSKEELVSDVDMKKGQKIQIENILSEIKLEITGLDVTRDIETQQRDWMDRIGELENNIAKLTTKHSAIERDEIVARERLKEYNEQLVDISKSELVLSSKIDENKKEEMELLNHLKTMNESWYHYDSIYKRESSITSYLENRIEGLYKDKEYLIDEERRAGRFLDDYENQPYFVSDPRLKDRVLKWKTKFTLLETGSKYIQSLVGENVSDVDSLWASSVVVKADEIIAIKELLENDSENFLYPVIILSDDQALEYAKNRSFAFENIVAPNYWSDNLNQDFFESWKEKLADIKLAKTEMRKKHEREIKYYNDSLNMVNTFLIKYPYETLKKMENDVGNIRESIKRIEIEKRKVEKKCEENIIAKKLLLKKVEESKDEKNQLNEWVRAVHKYIIKSKAIRKLSSEISLMEEDIEEYSTKIKWKEKEKGYAVDKKENSKNDFSKIKSQLDILKSNELYGEVVSCSPKYSDWTKEGLIERYKVLEGQYNQNKGDIDLRERSKRGLFDEIKSLSNDLEEKRFTSAYDIDESIRFDVYGEEFLKKLKIEVFELKQQIEQSEQVKDDHRMKLASEEGSLKALEKMFYSSFEEKVSFDDSIENIKNNIKREKNSIKLNQAEIDERKKKFLSEKKEVEGCVTDLAILDGKYEFKKNSIDKKELDSDFKSEFVYNRKRIVEKISSELSDLERVSEECWTRLEESKTDFIKYAESNIKATRLKEQTVLGIKTKKDYPSVKKWENMLSLAIKKTIRFDQDDMREHDKDLEQYVNHLHIYLKSITEELSIIPKQTRVKVDDVWKEIFAFHIPSWQEEDGKNEIRKHIDWILQMLDSDIFRNPDGTENDSSIHSEIEKWLDIKQLLPIVMKNNTIKVKCRKVKNHSKISSEYFSWESSNKWSGGEKWSKNMTLFLGILKYVAEKRQGKIKGSNTRVVIVDNPFGQASSGHVLEPVFYIAEKLGFQMIALTALAEGDFIRRYFPVVYSCKLRQSTNNATEIMNKEKIVKYAFFKDENPSKWGKDSL